MGALIRPVGEHDHVLPVVGHRIGASRVDNQWSVHTLLLLATGVTVKPVRPRLPHRKSVGERFARLDPVEADPGYTVHIGRYEKSVPVQRRVLIEPVCDPEDGFLTLPKSNERPGYRLIDGIGLRAFTAERDAESVDHQVVLDRCRRLVSRRVGGCPRGPGPKPEACQDTQSCRVLDEASPR